MLGVIILPITSGDTALRSLRLMVSDALNVDQTKRKNAIIVASIIFIGAALLLIWAKTNPSGFNTLWRYFSWANETIVAFTFAMITVYMMRNKMPYIFALVPGTFYMFMTSAYLVSAPIGLRLPYNAAYPTAAVVAFVYVYLIMKFGRGSGDVVKMTNDAGLAGQT